MSLLHELSLEGQAPALILTPQDKPLDLAISTYRLYFDLVSHLPDNVACEHILELLIRSIDFFVVTALHAENPKIRSITPSDL